MMCLRNEFIGYRWQTDSLTQIALGRHVLSYIKKVVRI